MSDDQQTMAPVRVELSEEHERAIQMELHWISSVSEDKRAHLWELAKELRQAVFHAKGCVGYESSLVQALGKALELVLVRESELSTRP